MKDNSYSRNPAVETKGISYLQLGNDNSVSKEDRILNKEIQYLKPALNMKTVTKLTKTDGNYFNLTNLNSLKGDTADNFNRFHNSAQSPHLSYSSLNNEKINNKAISKIPSKNSDSRGNKQTLNMSNNSYNNATINKDNNINPEEDNNEILDYSQEFKNYQNLFNKMKSEISHLNKKLNEIDKTSQQGSNFSLDSNSSKTLILKKENHEKDSLVSKKLNNYQSEIFPLINISNPHKLNEISFEENRNPNMNSSQNKICLDSKFNFNRSQDKEMFPLDIRKNLSYSSSFMINTSNGEKKKTSHENTFKERKEDIQRARSQSQNTKIDNILGLTPKKKKVPINPKKTSVLLDQNYKKASNIPKSTFDYKKENTEYEKQNKDILSEIELIEGILRNQYGFTFFENYDENQNAKSHLRMELEVYKNRVENVGEKYLEIIRDLNNSVKQDKEQFIKKIKDITQFTTKSIIEIKNKYNPSFTKYEININKLKKDNESIKAKLNNMKRILSDL